MLGSLCFCRSQLRISGRGHALWSFQLESRWNVQPVEDQEDADFVQAPPAEDHEVVLRHQPQPRRQRSEAALTENGSSKKSSPGKKIAINAN